MAEHSRFVIGIDGGGTKTHAILVGLDGTVISEAKGGPTNLQTVGTQQVAKIFFELIKDCCTKGECPPEGIQSVVMGIAGAGRASDKSDLVDALYAVAKKKKLSLKQIIVETDARIALEAAFAGGSGVVVIAGTGSIALYRTEDGKILRAGGWGKILGDEGGGYSIARDALNLVMREHDGRSEKTLLTKKAVEFFGVSSVDELIPTIYLDHADLASFTPSVFEAVNERDRVANGIVLRNANELVELVRVLTMKVRPRKKLPVALMGGLLENENVYSKIVREKIIGSLPHVVVQKPKFPAAFGAAIIGLHVFR